MEEAVKLLSGMTVRKVAKADLLSVNPTVEQTTIEIDVTLPSQEDRRQEVVSAEPEPERYAVYIAVEPRQSSSAETDQGMELPSVECGGLGLGLFYGNKPRATRTKRFAGGSSSAAAADRPNRSSSVKKGKRVVQRSTLTNLLDYCLCLNIV